MYAFPRSFDFQLNKLSECIEVKEKENRQLRDDLAKQETDSQTK